MAINKLPRQRNATPKEPVAVDFKADTVHLGYKQTHEILACN